MKNYPRIFLHKARAVWILLTLEIFATAAVYASAKAGGVSDFMSILLSCSVGILLVIADMAITHNLNGGKLFLYHTPEKLLDDRSDSGTLPEKRDSALGVESDDRQFAQEQMASYPDHSSVLPLTWEQEQLQLEKHLDRRKQLHGVRDQVHSVLEELEPELEPAIQAMVLEAAFSYLENLPFDNEGSAVSLPFHWIKETLETTKKAYARIHNPRTAANITVDELEKLLDRIEDARFLGESDLASMHCVVTRLNQETLVPTLVEKGIAVREVLNAALEQLRGTELRRDTASDWRLYNILYYRYFQYLLKNEQIAARLQFTSIRQYYRERNQALEAMLNALLEMENVARRSSLPSSTLSKPETER